MKMYVILLILYFLIAMNNFKFKWIIDDKLMEGRDTWDVTNYKRIWFTNGVLNVGIKNNYHFFINGQEFDFKISGEFIPFQLKTNSFNLQTGKDELIAYSIGFKSINENNEIGTEEKYFFIIKRNIIIFRAEKDDKIKSLEVCRL